MSDDQRSEGDYRRRRILRAVGAGAVSLPLAAGQATADPPDGDGPPGRDGDPGNGPPESGPSDPCPECSEEVAKYEWNGNRFVLERGEDVVEFTEIEYKDGNEPIRVCWEADEYDYVTSVRGKHGPEIDTFDGGTENCAEIDEYAFSFLAFCSTKAPVYQLDFVVGDEILEDCCMIDRYGDRVLASVFGSRCGGIVRRVSDIRCEYDVDDYTDCFDADGGCGPETYGEITVGDEEGTVAFTPSEDGDCPETLSFVSYEVTSQANPTKMQDLVDSVTVDWDDLDLDEENELTVDLPEDD